MSLSYFYNPHKRYNTQWTQKRVETLKQLWADGLSASEIANSKQFNTTRNAVIGKVWRLKLSTRKTGESAQRKPRKANGVPKLRPQSKPPPPPPIAPDMRKLTFFQLEPQHCRWPCDPPLEDLQQPARLFCAADTHECEIYCPFHMREARVRRRDDG